MDCRQVNERTAPYLDGELAPGEGQQVEEHLTRCPACAALVEALAAQPLGPARPPEAIDETTWGAMDRVLARELDRKGAAGGRPRFWQREFAVRGSTAFGYAAALALSILWGVHSHREAAAVEREAADLAAALERERREPADPTAVLPPPDYDLAGWSGGRDAALQLAVYAPLQGTW
jgi:anti-sigma factor RsiW